MLVLAAPTIHVGSGPDNQQPLAPPPEYLMKAGNAISGAIGDAFGLDDHDLFLLDWWPVPLNNSSMMNLSA